MTPKDEARFWGKVDRRPSGCWPWLGFTRSGYGRFKLNQRHVTAHRLAYELTIAPIPDGLVLDHLCRNRSCCNPFHLEPVTSRTNTLRGDTPAARQVLRTHCPHGHPYAGDNLYVWRRNRYCRACIAARKALAKGRSRPDLCPVCAVAS